MISPELFLIGLAVFVIFYAAAKECYTPYQRARMLRRIKCIFGTHSPGFVRNEWDGRRVQRCDYCDRVVYEYEVTKDELNRETIRRL